MLVSFPGIACGGGMTNTVTESMATQPFPSVMVTVYVVVMLGFATGLAAFVELKSIAGDQLKEYGAVPPAAVGEPPSEIDPPLFLQ